MQKNAQNIADKTKNDSYLRKLKKYNPLFPEKYHSEEFNLPNMIVIVDDAVRRGIDVCEGAIGWLSDKNGMEVLYLYDEAIKESGLQFVPSAVCDTAYYVDRFDRKTFVQTDYIFGRAHEGRMAELKYIAYSLGAKRCSIEIDESSIEVKKTKKKTSVGGSTSIHGIKTSSAESVENSFSYEGSTHRNGIINIEFEGSKEVKRPQLKWFTHTDNIVKLIDMRCEDGNSIKNETLLIKGAASAVMSRKTACAIDNALSKINVKGSSDMEGQAVKESQSKMIFSIEF